MFGRLFLGASVIRWLDYLLIILIRTSRMIFGPILSMGGKARNVDFLKLEARKVLAWMGNALRTTQGHILDSSQKVLRRICIDCDRWPTFDYVMPKIESSARLQALLNRDWVIEYSEGLAVAGRLLRGFFERVQQGSTRISQGNRLSDRLWCTFAGYGVLFVSLTVGAVANEADYLWTGPGFREEVRQHGKTLKVSPELVLYIAR